MEITAAGTAPELHRIPFSSFKMNQSRGKSTNYFLVMPHIMELNFHHL